MSKKIVAILAEKPFVKGSHKSNPSVAWLERYYADSDVSYLMRGDEDSSSDVIYLPESSNTLDFLKKYLTNKNFRKKVKSAKKLLSERVKQSDQVWVRGPSLVPLLLSKFWSKKIQKKLTIHICANRLNLDYLKKYFSIKNLFRFIYGIVLMKVYQTLEKRGVQFFYTGSQVKSNFGIEKGNYLIDFINTEKRIVQKVEGFISLGRLSKMASNGEMKRFGAMCATPIEVYGPGSQTEVDKLSQYKYKGVITPDEVANTISGYRALVCITNEYYEGLPRVIPEAMQNELWIIISRESVFINDLLEYPKLIISENITSSQELDNAFANFDKEKTSTFSLEFCQRSLL